MSVLRGLLRSTPERNLQPSRSERFYLEHIQISARGASCQTTMREVIKAHARALRSPIACSTELVAVFTASANRIDSAYSPVGQAVGARYIVPLQSKVQRHHGLQQDSSRASPSAFHSFESSRLFADGTLFRDHL